MVLKELNRLRYRSGVAGLNALMQIAEDREAPANARVSAQRGLCVSIAASLALDVLLRVLRQWRPFLRG